MPSIEQRELVAGSAGWKRVLQAWHLGIASCSPSRSGVRHALESANRSAPAVTAAIPI
jgi:hypothetical protein